LRSDTSTIWCCGHAQTRSHVLVGGVLAGGL
jgi:hypothetical protein